MKRQLLTCCLAMCSLATMAQHDEWKNPEINAVNRVPMHTNYFAYSSSEEAAKAGKLKQLYDPEWHLEIQLGEKCRCSTDRLLPDRL